MDASSFRSWIKPEQFEQRPKVTLVDFGEDDFMETPQIY
jgi:hypothetical protein